MVEQTTRTVVLRDERHGRDWRHLEAYLDAAGNLYVDGQDIGPGTSMVSGDGEYEWRTTVGAEHLSQLVDLLGGDEGADLLDVLEQWYTGPGAYALEEVLSGGAVPIERSVWGG